MTKPILLAMGTRPEIIKMAPVYHELKKNNVPMLLLHTGQHSDMAIPLYRFFGIVPDYNVEIDRSAIAQEDCELASLSSLLLSQISKVLKKTEPSVVLVHGDTSSALMAALASFYQQIPIGHVEAGLRSRNEYNPFPEEKNRVLIGQMAHWHFAPTARAKENLLSEGVDASRIHVVGNSVVEAAQHGASQMENYRTGFTGKKEDSVFLDMLSSYPKGTKILLVTVHRRENQEKNIALIAQAIVELVEKNEDFVVVWPVHPNPIVKKTVYNELKNVSKSAGQRLHLTEPLEYPVLLWILRHAWVVLTDSGGIQEEAVSLDTPVLVLRETTERPEVIEAGAALLIGSETKNIVEQVESLHKDSLRYEAMCKAKNPFGDGTTASQICKILMTQ
ncbi:MAG: UDP-N-acetylglucosamine 2-epimerase (non-hydrolyzing) [Alphaproteobacteria bacterium]|nr:UDP-N-acetylglucosamine 2-epimerase (non-hydrolyzing) [Alphaproteobacteria bacterium]